MFNYTFFGLASNFIKKLVQHFFWDQFSHSIVDISRMPDVGALKITFSDSAGILLNRKVSFN